MPQACAQLRTAALERGWEFEALHESEMFVRLRLASSDTLLVDLATDVAPGRPPHLTVVGPTFDQEELAGRELLALFDRAKARDFVDVYALAQRFGIETLVERAREVDLGFDNGVLVVMIRTLERFRDDEFPTAMADVAPLRSFFAMWAHELDPPQ